MDLQSMRNYIRRLLNEEGSSDGFYSDDELNDYINEAYRELIKIFPANHLDALYSLASSDTNSTSTGTISLPSDYDRSISIKYGDYYCTHANYLTQDLLDDDPWYLPSTIEPVSFIDGTNLYVKPVPTSSTTVILRYIAIPAELSDDNDTPEVDETYHEMICIGALERAKVKDNEFEEGAYHFNRMVKRLYRHFNEYLPEEKLRR